MAALEEYSATNLLLLLVLLAHVGRQGMRMQMSHIQRAALNVNAGNNNQFSRPFLACGCERGESFSRKCFCVFFTQNYEAQTIFLS